MSLPATSLRLRRGPLGLLAICLGALVLRLSPFFRHDGPLGWPIDYDEGVYTAATLLLTRGLLPYRDFFFAHPPGVIVLLAPVIGFFAPATAMSVARIAIACCSAVTVYALGRTVARQVGWPSALFAAALYASWPHAVVAERAVMLEPLLNLFGIAAAWSWLGQKDESRVGRTGVLLGLMLTVKWWAAAWLVAALLTAPNRARALALLATTLATFGVVALPFVLFAPAAFFEQTLLFHLVRPPDGDLETGVRLRELFLNDAPRGLIALAAAALAARQWRERPSRFALTVCVLLLAAFLLAAAFWNSYVAHLALPLCLASGLGLGRTLPHRGVTGWLIAALSLACVVPGLQHVLSLRHLRDPAQQQRAKALERHAKPACSFEVADVLLANQLPANKLIDSYGAMLFEATKGGRRYAHASLAFADDEAQRAAQIALFPCEIVVLGPRGDDQFSASLHWQQSHLEPLGGGVFRKTK